MFIPDFSRGTSCWPRCDPGPRRVSCPNWPQRNGDTIPAHGFEPIRRFPSCCRLAASRSPSWQLFAFNASGSAQQSQQVFPLPDGAYPHDVAPAPDGKVWYSAQRNGALGILDPSTGQTREIKLGPKSAPHGVIQGPDGAAWLTDGGQNAIVRVDPETEKVTGLEASRRHRLHQPEHRRVRQGRRPLVHGPERVLRPA